MKKAKVVGWWSGGVTSAVTCKLIIDIYGLDNCQFLFMDTRNEHEDTYRFFIDCQKWYGKPIEMITALGKRFNNIEEIWTHYETLNTATGAICSSTLKRDLRLQWEKENEFLFQAFGFDMDEAKRAKSMSMNHKQAKPIFPLMLYGYKKKDCIEILESAGIKIPVAYNLGFNNNNCLKTGCIQGGIGYWQKMKRDFPVKFNNMAQIEHDLTDKKGKPVTMCKDQSNEAKNSGNTLVFLKKHPEYPEVKCIDEMKGREPKPLVECNGFCGTRDLEPKSPTVLELNFDETAMVS